MKDFSEKAYKLLGKVPKSKVTTYKELANALNTTAYRAIGQAMRCNPYAPRIPCHRVVLSSGKIGGFQGEISGTKINRKKQMLEKEGIEFEGNKIKNFEKVFFRF